MRPITRETLEAEIQQYLDRKQSKADRKRRLNTLLVEREWKTARGSQSFKKIFAMLKSMMGKHERCMYCLDSHGTDIEHFWPKNSYPERLFVWPNMLLCCTECGRFKGTRFPLQNGIPLLIDPTAENPWLHLDFDPDTGNLVARFDLIDNKFSPKGEKTVEILQLDRREALASGYRKTFLRLSALLSRHIAREEILAAADLIASLRDMDDHGILEWCFLSNGQRVSPFSVFREEHPMTWNECVEILQE